MAAPRPFGVGKTIILLTSESDPLSDGRITGWIEALGEDASQTYVCFIPQEWERMTVLQRAYKNASVDVRNSQGMLPVPWIEGTG